jgi:PHP family Zn ribbon phosphoesterase
MSYEQITETIRLKDAARFRFTIETDPAYGKYHWTGHRDCNVSLCPKDAIKFANICPVCRRKLTKGVEQRVEELADRPEGFSPKGAIGFMRLLPLSEIVAAVLGLDSPSTQKVWSVYNSLVARFGNEYAVLIEAGRDQLSAIAGEEIADAVLKVRECRAKVIPGYDGVYGQLIFSEEHSERKMVPKRVQQLNLTDFSL